MKCGVELVNKEIVTMIERKQRILWDIMSNDGKKESFREAIDVILKTLGKKMNKDELFGYGVAQYGELFSYWFYRPFDIDLSDVFIVFFVLGEIRKVDCLGVPFGLRIVPSERRRAYSKLPETLKDSIMTTMELTHFLFSDNDGTDFALPSYFKVLYAKEGIEKKDVQIKILNEVKYKEAKQ